MEKEYFIIYRSDEKSIPSDWRLIYTIWFGDSPEYCTVYKVKDDNDLRNWRKLLKSSLIHKFDLITKDELIVDIQKIKEMNNSKDINYITKIDLKPKVLHELNIKI